MADRPEFDWDNLGRDDGGLPIHLPMGVTKSGQGPADGTPALHHYECWCGDPKCPLTMALKSAWRLGVRMQRPPPKIHVGLPDDHPEHRKDLA